MSRCSLELAWHLLGLNILFLNLNKQSAKCKLACISILKHKHIRRRRRRRRRRSSHLFRAELIRRANYHLSCTVITHELATLTISDISVRYSITHRSGHEHDSVPPQALHNDCTPIPSPVRHRGKRSSKGAVLCTGVRFGVRGHPSIALFVLKLAKQHRRLAGAQCTCSVGALPHVGIAFQLFVRP